MWLVETGSRTFSGWRDIVCGAGLLGIGLLFGTSIFTGEPSTLDWLFDVLGIFWIATGIYRLATTSRPAA